MCAQANADEIYEYAEHRDPDAPIDVQGLAKICQSYIVHCLRHVMSLPRPCGRLTTRSLARCANET